MIVLMNEIGVYVALFLVGLSLGSFSGATVWRLRAKSTDKTEHDDPTDVKRHEAFKKIRKATAANDRSLCLSCGHQLAWYDLIPLVSWLSLRGRCRYCRAPIGYMEPLIEFGLAAFFVLSYAFWPQSLLTPIDYTIFALWLASGVGLAIIFAYDAKWFLVPYQVVYVVIGLGLISAILTVIRADDPIAQLWSIIGALVVLAGLYYALYVVSKHAWVGFGDVQIGVALALLLADWQLAFLTLFLANLIGTIMVLPGLINGKLSRASHVPFGPLLIAGFAIAGLVGNDIITWYLNSVVL